MRYMRLVAFAAMGLWLLWGAETKCGEEQCGIPKGPDPMLTYMRQTLQRPDMRPQLPAGLAIPLGADAFVDKLQWMGEEQLLLVATLPGFGFGTTQYLHFVRVAPNGSLSDLGKWHVGIFHASRCHIRKLGSDLVCVFFDDENSRPKGAIKLGESNEAPSEVALESEIVKTARHWDLGKEIGVELLAHVGPLRLLDGHGNPIVQGALPPSLYVLGDRFAPSWQSGDRVRAAFLTVGSRELAGWWESPPREITILEFPEAPGGECKIVRQFHYASPDQLPPPDWQPQWHYRSLISVAANSWGTRVSYAELLRFDSRKGAGNMCLWRLWLWDEATDNCTLVATRVEYYGIDEYSFTVNDDGTVRRKKEESPAWASPYQMLSALSPSGKMLAYIKGSDLHIVELP